MPPPGTCHMPPQPHLAATEPIPQSTSSRVPPTNQHLVPPNDGWVSDSGFAAQFTSPVGTVPALSATHTHHCTRSVHCSAPDASVPQRAEHTPDATSAAQVASRAPLPAAQMLSKNPPTAAPPTAARAPRAARHPSGMDPRDPWIGLTDPPSLKASIPAALPVRLRCSMMHPQLHTLAVRARVSCCRHHVVSADQSTASPMPAPFPSSVTSS
ncbi:hypothetical protein ACCO45_013735 [Purpureocillium lilacinum]|uniref:Uncharacterized protein n=1 Tax=Purpureocillium lilacinum TaxID=33203 RepID=A0ACC4D7G4_PURLI